MGNLEGKQQQPELLKPVNCWYRSPNAAGRLAAPLGLSVMRWWTGPCPASRTYIVAADGGPRNEEEIDFPDWKLPAWHIA